MDLGPLNQDLPTEDQVKLIEENFGEKTGGCSDAAGSVAKVLTIIVLGLVLGQMLSLI